MVGMLEGKDKNRVKAKKLRGVLSQGLLLDLFQATEVSTAMLPYKVIGGGATESDLFVVEGQDVMGLLGITKYEPVASWQRSTFAGHNIQLPEVFSYHYDIENIKRWPDIFTESDDVVITEKVHGTFMAVCALPERMGGGVWVTSKGLMGRGIALDTEDSGNIYVGMAYDKRYNLAETAQEIAETYNAPVSLFGEVYGRGVQDLTYGVDRDYRLFDIRESCYFMDYETLCSYAFGFKIPMVPTLYTGPFSKDMVLYLTNGKEQVSREESNIREGVVVKSVHNKFSPYLGRMILKSVSEAYLLRKGATEFN